MPMSPTSRIKARPGSSQVKLDLDIELIREMKVEAAKRGFRVWEVWDLAARAWLQCRRAEENDD